MSHQSQHASSFRDPAGFIFTHKGTLYRQINHEGQTDFDHFIQSGLYDALVKKGILVAHSEVKKNLPPDESHARYKVIRPARVPFISHPYEWSFSQLKDAALLTLRIQKIAFKHGMILKDASAYNVQFIGKKPILIDTLSFKKYLAGDPWEGYRQFCEHFLAPLAVARYTSYDMLKMLEVELEGMPLELACALLPRRARFAKGLFSHLYLHNASQKRYQNVASEARGAVPKRKVSTFALEGIVASLERSVRALRAPQQKTEWGNYYTFTNYSDQAFKRKQKLARDMLGKVQPKPLMVWDMGANNGEFSVLAARMGAYTVAFDIDPVAVERNYRQRDEASDDLMMPLVQDCTNPSSAVGWMLRERESLIERGPADVVMALAIVHHLAIGRNLPLPHIAEFLASIGKHVIIEFVPKGDSKVQILLASRKDIFPDYDIEHFEAAMSKHFKLVEKQAIKQTKRTLYLYKKK
jgi:2-polyprenyl-3-methyl-5-hydroxy-6-metoxy-1,4-benzoquinol methylase